MDIVHLLIVKPFTIFNDHGVPCRYFTVGEMLRGKPYTLAGGTKPRWYACLAEGVRFSVFADEVVPC